VRACNTLISTWSRLATCLTFFALNLPASPQPINEASPLVGTGGHGHTYPGATAPFGLVQLSPDTRVHDWDACAGYHYSDSSIWGFSHTHLSGTGIRDMGDLLILPVTGPLNGTNDYSPIAAMRFSVNFSHTNEAAQPGYYRVLLDNSVLAELTATPHAGMHRYTFPASEQSHLLIDLVHGLENVPIGASLKIEHGNLITGHRRSKGWAQDKVIYFAIECSQPWQNFGIEAEGKPLPKGTTEIKGTNLRAHLDFITSAGQQILLRVGLSPTSIEGAKSNLRVEIPSWDFDSVRVATQQDWSEQLSRIQIESPNSNIRQTFYSALYHTMLAPTMYNDANGGYRGPDGKTHPAAGFQYYSTFSLWDTFRAEHPLLTLTQPGRVNDFVQSMLVYYKQSPTAVLPVWPLASWETWCMIGYHSLPVIWDAYAKGFRGFDSELAFQAMKFSATHNRERLDEYQKLGYIPWVKGRQAATSTTLEYAYDDWCLAQMAGALGKTNDAQLFARRAQNYRNVWDAQTRFFRSKTEDGTYLSPFDPKEVSNGDVPASGYFTEANAWQYLFAVFHDVPGMMELFGGREAFIARLDEMFDQDSFMTHYASDVSGLIGQYAHGNEPCHHVSYLYALAGAQYKTARRVRQIMLTQYDNTPEGLCGNDDCGQMSAWYVFSAIGLYPVNPADGIYVIGSPLVEKAVIKLDPQFYPGGTFTVIARNASKQHCYVKSAKLNGAELKRPWVTHAEIAAGGTLELEMDLLPNKNMWAQFE
jgi:predicted alpha-1,2-mannosidase